MDLSPDNSKAAVEVLDANGRNGEIWAVELSRGISTRFTFDPGADLCPIWSPDGTKIVFWLHNREGKVSRFISEGHGNQSSTDEFLKDVQADSFPTSWHTDGKFLVYQVFDQHTKGDVWLLPTTSDRKPVPLSLGEWDEVRAQVSPDGHWIAYSSDESGRSEIYVQTMPPSGVRYQVSNGGGMESLGCKDGKEIFFISSDNKLMAAQVLTTEPFETTIPKPLFTIQERFAGPEIVNYAVNNDGNRFLINTVSDSPMGHAIHLITNWTAKQDQ